MDMFLFGKDECLIFPSCRPIVGSTLARCATAGHTINQEKYGNAQDQPEHPYVIGALLLNMQDKKPSFT
jgi:hypothetical protein